MRKRKKRKLIRTKEDCLLELSRLRAVLDAVPGYVSWVTRDFHYIGVNKKLARALGMSPSEIEGKKVGFHSKDQTFLRFIKSVFLLPKPGLEKTIVQKIQEKERYIYLIGRKYAKDQAAVILGFDVTSEKEKEALLREKNRQILESSKLSSVGMMAAALAHEINNPLCVVLAQAELALQALAKKDYAKLSQKIEEIRGTALRLKDIVDGLKGFVYDGEDKKTFQHFSVKDLLHEVRSLAQGILNQSKIPLELHMPQHEVFLTGKKVQIAEILFNLIQNSCDAVSKKKEKWIRLEVKDLPEKVQFIVTDSGKGIPEKIREHLFDPLFTTKAYGKGTGLGLSVSKTLAQAHGGDLELNVHAPNTQFILEIPKKIKKKRKKAA